MKRTYWVALSVIAAVAAAGIAVWLDNACEREFRRTVMKASGSVGCFEFWLNRYQGLAAGFLAAGIALIVARPVFRQLREMNRQSAVAIRGVEEAYARELEAEMTRLASYRDIHNRLHHFVDSYDEVIAVAHQHATTYNNNFTETLREAGAYLRDLSALFARYPDNSPLSVSRKEFLRAANAHRSACGKVHTGFRNETFGADVEEGEPEMNAEEVAAARAAAEVARGRVLTSYGGLNGRIRSEIKAQWGRVRHLQRMARREV